MSQASFSFSFSFSFPLKSVDLYSISRTPRTPTHQRTQSPLTTPRSSARVRGLPIDQSAIQSAPKMLQNNLAGWHERNYGVKPIGESSSDESSEEDDDDDQLVVTGKPKAAAVAKVASRPPPAGDRPMFPAHKVFELMQPLQRVLAGLDPPKASGEEEHPKSVLSQPCLDGYDAWERPLRYSMEGVVKNGLGNCLMLLGQHGVGKKMLVERSLRLVAQVYGEDSFIPVRLSGLAQTTDRQALRAIARQLKCGGFDEEEEGADWGSNAALMTSLLRMLEPPASSSTPNKPVILVLEEFDLFALHPRQSFLYCLLDIVQGNRRQGGMGVIGLSSRIDCLSILEKRVRSRCQGQVHLLALPNSYQAFKALALSLLLADGPDEDALVDGWNDEVGAFLTDPDTTTYLDRLWKLHGNVPTQLRQALAHMLRQVEFTARHSTADWTSPAPSLIPLPRLDATLLPPASIGLERTSLLSHLTLLDLHVCVAAVRVRNLQLAVSGACSLELLYSEYRQHLDSRRSEGVLKAPFSHQAFAMSFDRLVAIELFLPLTGKPQHFAAPSRASRFGLWRFVPWADAVKAEVQARVQKGDALRKWVMN